MLERIVHIPELVSEMLDQLSAELWTSSTTTFLDPAMGSGQFVSAIERRLAAHGHSADNIAARVSGYEDNRLLIDLAKNLHGLVGQYSKVSYNESLQDGDNMKFDVIIGNPPYQKENNSAKRWTLWELFVEKSLGMGSIVAMVVPQSLTSPGKTFEMIRSKCTVLNIDVSKHFNVGSTFCYFVADERGNGGKTRIVTDDAEYTQDIRQLPFIPVVINPTTMAQINDLMARPKRLWKRGELHTSNTAKFSVDGQYTVMHTNAQTLRSDVDHPNRNKIRVGVTLSGYPTFKVVLDGYMSQACFWTEFDTVAEAQMFADDCNGDTVQGLLEVFKWSGWNSKEVIKCL